MNIKKIISLKDFKFRINGICILTFSLLYIYISIFLFLFFWVKPIFSIPSAIVLFIALLEYLKKSKERMKNITPIYIKLKMLIVLFFVISFVGWILGWTGFSDQVGDWWKHNAVLNDLTELDWPVIYENNDETSMLTYYIGQYLVPAFIGKIFLSSNLTFVLNGIWAMIGLFFAILGIFKITKSDSTSKQIIALIVTLNFSTCIILSQFLGKIFFPSKNIGFGAHLIYDSDYILQYSNNMILLRYVMPQCIVPWIIYTFFLYDNPFDIKHYVLIYLPILFYSPFAFIVFLPILLVLLVINFIKNKNISKILKNIFSLSNILVFISLGVILILYFSGNVFSEKPDNLKLKLVNYKNSDILIYIFFILSFLPYTIILFKDNKKNPFYWVATSILLILPFFKFGFYNDLCMRASIIPLFIYMYLSINLLNNSNKTNYKIILLVLLLICNISSNEELKSAIEGTKTKFVVEDFNGTLNLCANRNLYVNDDLKYNYYTYDLKNSIFNNYLSREKYIQ